MGRALFAAGFRAGDLVHNSFSYHLTPAGSMMESGAHALGCTVFPAGTGQTELQLQAMAALAPRRLCRNAELPAPAPREGRRDRRRAAVADQGALERRGVAARRARLARHARHRRLPVVRHGRPRPRRLRDGGARGPGGRRRRDRRDRPPGNRRPGGRRRGRRDRRDDAEPRLPADPLATGDLSAVLAGACPTGRTNQRIRGWLGRADQIDQGARHVRPPGRRRRDRAPPSRGRAGAAGRRGRRPGRRPHDAAGRDAARPSTAWASRSRGRSAT